MSKNMIMIYTYIKYVPHATAIECDDAVECDDAGSYIMVPSSISHN